MKLKILTAVTDINNLSDARYCAGMGVDLLCFNLAAEQQDALSPAALQEITGWLAGIKIAGTFTNQPIEEINTLVQTCSLDLVQLNTCYLLDDLININIPVIQQVSINKDTDATEVTEILRLYKPYITYFLITSTDFNNIDETNIKLLTELASQFPVLLGFGFSPENILTILERIQPAGIALKGGHEIKPGLKSFDELADMLEMLEEE